MEKVKQCSFEQFSFLNNVLMPATKEASYIVYIRKLRLTCRPAASLSLLSDNNNVLCHIWRGHKPNTQEEFPLTSSAEISSF